MRSLITQITQTGKETIAFRAQVSGENFRTNMPEYKVEPSAYIRVIRGSNF